MVGSLVAGRWLIASELVAGGMGVVYRASDAVTGQQVALKRPGGRHHDPAARGEAYVLRLLRVPGVAQLLDEGEDENGPYLVTDWVEGAEFPGPDPDVEALVGRLLGTLAGVHALGIVHCDLKPANVLVDAKGEIWLVDFGIARGAATHAEAAEGAGTPSYLAPEQIAGDGTPDARTDLYAVGVMAFEALTGALPFGDDPIERLWRDAPALPGAEPLAGVVGGLLARAPEDRPASSIDALRLLGREPPSVRLRFVGRTAELATLRARIDARERADVAGPAGCGRSRLLEEAVAGREVIRLGPGWPLGMSETALQALLDAGHVVVVDPPGVDAETREIFDRCEGAILGCGGPAVVLGPLTDAELRGWIHGPDPLFHAREDVARELLARTGGWPGRAIALLTAWAASGIVRVDGDRVRLEPGSAERMASRSIGGLPGLLRTGTPVEAAEEAFRSAGALCAEGHYGRACHQLEVAFTAVRRRVPPATEHALLRALVLAALPAEDPSLRGRAAQAVRSSHVAGLDTLQDLADAAVALSGRQIGQARQALARLASSDDAVDRAIITLRVEAEVVAGPEGAEILLESLRSWAATRRDPEGLWEGWMGLLRYRQARFADAVAHHERAVSLRETPRDRLNATVNLAMALLDVGELEAAERLGAWIVTEAGATRHAATEARGWWLLRSAAYRRGAWSPADRELLDAIALVLPKRIAAPLWFAEAAHAWRLGDAIGAARLFELAADGLSTSDAGIAARVMAAALQGRPQLAARVVERQVPERPSALFDQARAASRLDGVPLPPSTRYRELFSREELNFLLGESPWSTP